MKSWELGFSRSRSAVRRSSHCHYCYYRYQGPTEETISYHYSVSQIWDLAKYLISWIITPTCYKREANDIILTVLTALT